MFSSCSFKFLSRVLFGLLIFLLLSALTIRALTPFINTYSKTLLLPVVKQRLPQEFSVENVTLEWDGAYPMLVLAAVQARHPSYISYVNTVDGMDVHIDIIKSILNYSLFFSSIYIDNLDLTLGVSSATITTASKIAESFISSFRSTANGFGTFFSVPKNVFIKKTLLQVSGAEYEIMLADTSYNYIDSTKKSWHSRVVSFNNHAVNIEASSIVGSGPNAAIEELDGHVSSTQTLPNAVTSLLLGDGYLSDVSGAINARFSYRIGTGFQVNSSYDIGFLKYSANKSCRRLLKGSSSLNFIKEGQYNLKNKFIFGENLVVDRYSQLDYMVSDDNAILTLDYLPVPELSLLLSGLPGFKNPLNSSNAEVGGYIQDIRAVYQGKVNAITEFNAKIRKLYLRSNVNRENTIRGVDLDVIYDTTGGSLNFINQDETVEVKNSFLNSKVLTFKHDPFRIKFSRSNDVYKFALHNIKLYFLDIIFLFDGPVEISSMGGLSFDISIASKRANLLSYTKLIPQAYMPPSLAKYLTMAIKKGEADYAEFNLGYVSGKKLTYSLNAYINNAEFSYAVNWPNITGVSGHLFLDNDYFTLKADKANFSGEKVSKFQVAVNNGANPVINVSAASEIVAAKALTILEKMPFKNVLQHYPKGVSLSGIINLNIAFALACSSFSNSPQLHDFVTQLTLGHNDLLYNGNSLLTAINGLLRITRDGVSSYGLRAMLDEHELLLDISNNHKYLLLKADGILDSATLSTRVLPANIASSITGSSYFTTAIMLAADGRHKVNLSSNLLGISYNFPKPFFKDASTEKAANVSIELNKDKLVKYKVNLGTDIKFLSDSTARLALYLPDLDFSVWQKYIFTEGHDFSLPPLKLYIKRFAIAEQLYKDITIGVINNSGNSEFSFKATDIDGVVKVSPKSLFAKFNYLRVANLHEFGSSNAVAVERSYDITINELVFDRQVIKNIYFQGDFRNKRFDLERLSFTGFSGGLSLKGYWQYGLNPQTYLFGNFSSNDFTRVMALFPEYKHIGAGGGKIDFKLSWPGSIYDLSFNNTSGIIKFDLHNGSFTELGDSVGEGIGVGAMFNLLSFQSILQKISLDFSDLDNNSFFYDNFIGSIKIKDAKIFTDKIFLKGSLGSVYTRGSIDFRSMSYDLYMTILPIVTSSIPTIATLAGGFVAGAIAWVANKVLEDPVSLIALQVYKITGKLENPVITALDKNNLPKEVILP